MHVLLSNDDGLGAEGLQLLRSTLKRVRPDWRITTVAPDQEQSATSHALTLTRPLRMEPHGDDQYAVSGTPTDCVLLAMNALLPDDRPDVVVSGINHGPNMGEDVHYSGTVAAAFEGRVLGLPSFALSLASKDIPRRFDAAERFVAEVLPGWLEQDMPHDTLLNVNIPATSPEQVKGVRVCRLGSRTYHNIVTPKEDPRGRAYFWIGGDVSSVAAEPDSDFVLSREDFITVTPLHVDLTHYDRMDSLRDFEGNWPGGEKTRGGSAS